MTYKNEVLNFKSGKKISDILHDAADIHLQSADTYWSMNSSSYSCIAVFYSLLNGSDFNGYYEDWEYWSKLNPEYKRILKGLRNMGLKTSDGEGTIFQMEGLDSQQTRYGWLKMAAMLAEEQESRGEI